MNDLNQEQELSLLPQSPQDTPPQVIEQEDVQPVVEVVKPVRPRARKQSPKRVPPEISQIFLTEEDQRKILKMNRMIVDKLGIKKNNSFKI